LKPPSRATWARIIPADLLDEFLVPVNDSVSFPHLGFRREPFSSLADGFVERVNLHIVSCLPYSLHSLVVVFESRRCKQCTTGLIFYVRNSFQSSTPPMFRMSAETGNSFGARGAESSFKPASCGNRSALRCLQRKPAGCREEAKWSQSPVLPWTQRAYETCLSAGSAALFMDA
jgi:hypothetical protein